MSINSLQWSEPCSHISQDKHFFQGVPILIKWKRLAILLQKLKSGYLYLVATKYTVYKLGQEDLSYSLAWVNSIPSWLVWVEIECTMHEPLP